MLSFKNIKDRITTTATYEAAKTEATLAESLLSAKTYKIEPTAIIKPIANPTGISLVGSLKDFWANHNAGSPVINMPIPIRKLSWYGVRVLSDAFIKNVATPTSTI